MAFFSQRLGSRRAVSISAVIAVHLAIGYALVTGLAYEVIKKRVTVMWVDEIPAPTPPAPPPLPPKLPDRKQLTVPDKIEIPLPPGAGNPPVSDQPPPQTSASDEGAGTSPPPRLARALQPRGNRAGWVTADDYPLSSVRNEEEGAVAITVRVGADGRVQSCRVTASSGHAALDEATCRVYAKRARFAPALSPDGTPVESSYADRVRWQLPEQ